MWHQAQFKGEELLVLGHDPRRNDCMLVKLSGLPMNEQTDLRRIAASRTAQESTHLIPILRRMPAPDGSDWFTYLIHKMQQRNSPVITLPIKEIQDSLDPDQKAVFKGYGKGRRNSSLDRDDLARAQSGGLDDYDDIPELGGQETVPVNNSLDYKMDLLIETVSDENRRTQELLSKLISVISGGIEVPAKRPVRPKRPARKRASAVAEPISGKLAQGAKEELENYEG
jgi:hypothetical protein